MSFTVLELRVYGFRAYFFSSENPRFLQLCACFNKGGFIGFTWTLKKVGYLGSR